MNDSYELASCEQVLFIKIFLKKNADFKTIDSFEQAFFKWIKTYQYNQIPDQMTPMNRFFLVNQKHTA